MHDLPKGVSRKDLEDLVLLFLVGRRGLQHHLLVWKTSEDVMTIPVPLLCYPPIESRWLFSPLLGVGLWWVEEGDTAQTRR